MVFVLEGKFREVIESIYKNKRCVVSFSGGMDSSLLLWLAIEATGRENVLPVHIMTPATTLQEEKNVDKISSYLDIDVEKLKINILDIREILEGSKLRCYFCKRYMLKHLVEIADKGDYNAVLEGSNRTDTEYYRPGLKALDEFKSVCSPFLEFRVKKREIRRISEEIGLPSADFESLACLLTRMPYEKKVTEKALRRIDKIEDFIRDFGVKQVRARIVNNKIRVETGESDIPKIKENQNEILELSKRMGFNNTTLDINLYKPGRFDGEHSG